jgi:hypothetical protein
MSQQELQELELGQVQPTSCDAAAHGYVPSTRSTGCDLCGHPDMRLVDGSLYCPRCGCSKFSRTDGSWWSRPGYLPTAEAAAQWDAEQNAPAGQTAHEIRWSRATSNPNGNY